jgi:hypothetical protein
MEEEGVDRRPDDSDAISAEEPMVCPIGHSLVSDSVRKVGHVRRVVAAKDAIKIGVPGEQSNVVANVR